MTKKKMSTKKSKRQSVSNQPSSSQDITMKMKHLELEPSDGMYSGTFRWTKSKQFPLLTCKRNEAPINLAQAKGWEAYLMHRGLLESTKQDPSCLDALTYPITAIHALQLLDLPIESKVFHIVIIGASAKAEQRVWEITNYWDEIGAAFSRKELVIHFTGPEIDPNATKSTTRVSNNESTHHSTVKFFRGTFGAFRQSHLDLNATNSVLMGFNTGFGSFLDIPKNAPLFKSWLEDLYLIAESNIPAIFTCANDYSDLNGEFAIQSKVIDAEFLLLPKQNPFSAASHLHADAHDRETNYSRANSFFYAIQGVHKGNQVRLQTIKEVQARLDEDLSLHFIDKLQREYIENQVLTQAQATAYKQQKAVGKHNEKVDNMEVPNFDIVPGARHKEVFILVQIPKVKQATGPIAIDVTQSRLTVYVPGVYLLQTQLPFKTSNDAVVATLTGTVLRLTCIRE